MDTFVFTLGIFAFWGVVGYATLTIFPARLRIIQSLLISPAVGIAVMLLPVFLINRTGIPVKNFGQPLLVGILVLSVLTILIKRPTFPIRRLLPMVGVLIAALVLAAWPMFLYHFDWVSYSNDDMANYCLGAQRFLNEGYFNLPNLNDLNSGRNYSLAYWFMHVAGGMRSGSELTLAVWWAATGLNAHQLFMSVIFGLHLSLICSTGALVAGRSFPKKAPLIAMSLLAISPLTTLGALYQLIGQIGGLTLLCSSIVLFYRGMNFRPLHRLITSNIVGGVSFSALLIWYPEALPFLGLGWIIFLGLKIRQNYANAKSIVIPSLLISLVALLLTGSFIFTAIQTLLMQTHGVMVQPKDVANLSDIILFPYFLQPTGIPILFGLIPLVGYQSEPFTTIAICLGVFILFWVLKQIITQLREPYPAAVVSALMFILSGILFFKGQDFGLFKLSMYVQPFLLAVVATSLSAWLFKRRVVCLFLGILVVGIMFTQFLIVAKSTGESLGALSEIPHASGKKINREFAELMRSSSEQKNNQFMSDTPNIVLVKFQSLYTQGISVYFPSQDFYGNIKRFGQKDSKTKNDVLKSQTNNGFTKESMTINGISNQFSLLQLPDEKNTSWILSYNQTIFNRKNVNKDKSNTNFHIVEKPINYLVFIRSQLGENYYLPENRKNIAMFQLENDPMFRGQSFSALGRYQLFMVVGPTPKPRVVLELTATVMKQFDAQLPSPSIYGASKTVVPMVGRGSARVISEPIEPNPIEGHQYINLDMGRAGKVFPQNKKGLMLIYGKNMHNDWRQLVIFGRDISLISEEEYQAITPPAQLEHFPADLANPNLEYSGIYEDGWISERSFFVLKPEANTKFLLIKGVVPLFKNSTFYSKLKSLKNRLEGGAPPVDSSNFHAQLKVLLNGKQVAARQVTPGAFEIKIPVHMTDGRQRIDLAFDNYLQLPGGDARIVGGKIDFIGFTEH